MIRITNLFIFLFLAVNIHGIIRDNPGGNIFFSNEMISPGVDHPIEPTDRFKLLDDLYALAELSGPMAETYDSLKMEYDYDDPAFNFNYALNLYLNGEYETRWLFEMPPDEFRNSTRLVFILNARESKPKRTYGYTVENWKELVSSLRKGVYRVRMDLVPMTIYHMKRNDPVLASGTFNIKVEPEHIGEFMESIPATLPYPTMINDDLEGDIIRASENVHPNLEPLKSIITDNKGDWSYGLDEHGNILRRYIVASVLYKNVFSEECEVHSAVFYQKHRGNGIFGDTFYLKPATGYYKYSLPCDSSQVNHR
jgi:hypothetical protein